MSSEENTFTTWEEVIQDFFRRKSEIDEEKYLKEQIKSVENLYSEVNFFDDDTIELVFNTKKYKKSKDETAVAFQRRRASELFKKLPESLNRFSILKQYVKVRKKLLKKYNPQNWFSENCNKASSVSFATHVIKLTHSKIDTPSLFDEIDDIKNGYMTTSSLLNKAIDGAVAGNQFAPIFQFLELELSGLKLAEGLSKGEQLFETFVKNDDKRQVEYWVNGFRKALDAGVPASHSLSKQVYFPTHTGIGNYHVLCNVISSSFAHAIYEKIFDERQKSIKKSFEEKKYRQEECVIFPQRSQLSVTASNHSNASQLNAKRGGKLHLFSTQPPVWQSQFRPPIYKKSLFSNLYNATIKTEIDYLCDFLMRFKELDLSIKDPKRKQHLERWVNNLIDEVLFYVGSIQNLPAGWSDTKDIKLKEAYQYLLDPYRNDDAFQAARQNKDWQKVIHTDFANWINRLLRGKDKQFTPKVEHTKYWKKLLEQPLREHLEQVDQEIKQRLGEAS